jgi:uncharacterized membrane protein
LFFVWFLLQILSPLLLPSGSISDLSGVVAIDDNTQIITSMPFPINLVYTAGDRLCHQQAERSLFLNGNEMPFCTRCTALWFGIVLGLGFMVLYSFVLTEKFLWLIFIGFTPIGIDGVGQLFGFWESTNSIRFLTGVLAGIVTGIMIALLIDESRDVIKSLKKKEKKSRSH